MMRRLANKVNCVLLLFLFFFLSYSVSGQVEIEPWGNLKGIRIDGQLMEVQSSIAVVKDWSSIQATEKEKQLPKFIRKGNQQIITTNIDSLYFTETVVDTGEGKASLRVELMPREAATLTGVYLRLVLPQKYFAKGIVQLDEHKTWNLFAADGHLLPYPGTPARSIMFRSLQRQVMVSFEEPTTMIFKPSQGKEKNIEVFIPIKTGSLQKKESITKNFLIKASGTVDKKTVTATLNTAAAGRSFDGLGGNFRLQNARTDPQVIDYSLANLSVAWGPRGNALAILATREGR